MDNKKPRILFIKPWSGSTFMDRDEKILKKYFEVEIFDLQKEKNSIFKIFKKLLNKEIDLFFIWFASYYFSTIILISRLFRVPSIVIVGGYDVANVPEFNYGQFSNSLYIKIRTRFILKNANKVLVVDSSLKEDAIKNAKISGENIDYMPTGYDSNYWKSECEKEPIVISVGNVNYDVIKRKGFETFVKAANFLPDIKFVLIGKHKDRSIDELKSIAPANVKFTGYVSDEELLNWYQRAKVYCQLSRYEGLPNALCEAMLCKCVPVGTLYCGVPTAIGKTGFYASYGNEKETVDAIKKALNTPKDFGDKARDRIIKLFPQTRREKELVGLTKRMTSKKTHKQIKI